jgi:hypothetical protein
MSTLKFNFTDRDTEEYKTWISFYPKRTKGTGFYLTYEDNGYFDPRPQINTNITTLLALILPVISLWLLPVSAVLCFYSWGSLYIHLPIDTGRNNTAENKTIGLMFYHVDSGFPTEAWFRGWKSFNFPWAWNFDKREVLHKSGWRIEQKGDDFWDKQKWKNEVIVEKHPYTYTLNSGIKQKTVAEVHEEKRSWKSWFGFRKKTSHYIEVEFRDEVGERAGSWKGGTMGCSYAINEGENALQCLRRMESERRFR